MEFKSNAGVSPSQLIFLGTGTSSQVPTINCLQRKPITCPVCSSGLAALKDVDGSTKSAKFSKNRRRNTSVVLRVPLSDGSMKTILIDCGKSFYESSMTWFTEYDLSTIDAVLLTHGHADAVFGLDDLRMWTAGGIEHQIQPNVNIYLNEETFKVASSAFPYLVNTANATGSGEIAALNFHMIEGGKSFTLFGGEVVINPFEVEHGFYSNKEPYYALGFRIGDLSYISDCSSVSYENLKIIEGSKYIVLDALKDIHHVSHISFLECIEALESALPANGHGYFTGLMHLFTHEEVQAYIKKKSKRKDVIIDCAFDGLLVEMQ